MKISSRNVNGIRAVMKKGFTEWLAKENPDILCIQETKAFEHQVPPELKYIMKDYEYVWHSGTRPG
jgi:exodeoxyribonuclease-3